MNNATGVQQDKLKIPPYSNSLKILLYGMKFKSDNRKWQAECHHRKFKFLTDNVILLFLYWGWTWWWSWWRWRCIVCNFSIFLGKFLPGKTEGSSAFSTLQTWKRKRKPSVKSHSIFQNRTTLTFFIKNFKIVIKINIPMQVMLGIII